jgi:hypothetical protein
LGYFISSAYSASRLALLGNFDGRSLGRDDRRRVLLSVVRAFLSAVLAMDSPPLDWRRSPDTNRNV